MPNTLYAAKLAESRQLHPTIAAALHPFTKGFQTMTTREIHILSPENERKAREGRFTDAICGTPDVWHNWTPAHQYATCQKCRRAMMGER